jgi:hypothetical protein
MVSRAVSMATGWQRARQDLFSDLRVRYGIKMGLAGLLALFCTQVLRLPHDNWAILTVVVLMSGRFVGSIAFKAIMRVTGTMAGALVGVWLVGDYTSTPAIFLLVLFLVIAFASYKYGQVGARQVPYAYYLLGFTTLTIATDGVTDPAQAWQIGLHRPDDCSQRDKRDSFYVRPAINRFKKFAAGRSAREHVFFRSSFQLQRFPGVREQPVSRRPRFRSA